MNPRRIVCLTAETTELLYLLGEQQRIVGISGFTVRPAQARKEKPRVSAFTSVRIEQIVGLQPDLVLGFSDLQAVRDAAVRLPCRPRVYFEEWDQPLICGIRWVSELIAIAGGEDCFADLAALPSARQRIIAEPAEVVRRSPQLIIGSWCGKHFRAAKVSAREGWSDIPAVRNGQLREIKSCDILQPGPAALTDGLRQLQTLIAACANL